MVRITNTTQPAKATPHVTMTMEKENSYVSRTVGMQKQG